MAGRFIVVEGVDGSGKGTQTNMVAQKLSNMDKKYIRVREPGGTPEGEQIRSMLLNDNKGIVPEAELLLFSASRSQLVNTVILPALEEDLIVLSDRYIHSSLAYQGYGLGLDIDWIKQVNDYAVKSLMPDVTFILDVNIDEAFGRMDTENLDSIEQRDRDYFLKVRMGYLKIACDYKNSIVIGSGDVDKVYNHIDSHLDRLFEEWF